MRVAGKITKTESEKVVGEDEHKVPIVECPEVVVGRGERWWYTCPECLNDVLVNRGEYYHKLACSKSNGIGYGDERKNTTLPHHPSCDCLTCKPPKGGKATEGAL